MRKSEKELVLKIVQTVEVLPLNEKYGAYRIQFSASKSVPLVFQSVVKPVEMAGVALLSELEAYEKGTLQKVPFHHIYLASPDLAEAILNKGAPEAFETDGKNSNRWKYLLPVSVEDFRKDPSLKERLVFADITSHRVASFDGVQMPVGIHFNYESGMSDEYFDLEGVLKALLASDRVLPRKTSRDDPPAVFKILDIPYYNASEERSKHLSFTFKPTAEEMAKLVAYKASKGGRGIGWQWAVMALDLMDLKQFMKDPSRVWD